MKIYASLATIASAATMTFSGLALAFPGSTATIRVLPGNCSAINAAIKALPPEGGRVQLYEGTYNCDAPVLISRDNVSLIGLGRAQTILKLSHGKAMPALVIGELGVKPEQTRGHGIQFYPAREVKNVTVRGLTVLGDFSGARPDADRECFDVEANKSMSCDNDGGRLVRNNGVTIRHSSNVTIEDVRADRHLSGGMVVEKHSHDLKVDGFYASNNSFDGFAGYETHDSTFKNMKLTQNTMSGISIDFEFDHNTFDHVTLLRNGDNGVFSHSVSNKYLNMIVGENHNYAIYIDGRREKQSDGTWLIIPNNCDNQEFRNITMFDNAHAGIRINSSCKDSVIENVEIKTGNALVPCVSLWQDATVSYLGKFSCIQN